MKSCLIFAVLLCLTICHEEVQKCYSYDRYDQKNDQNDKHDKDDKNDKNDKDDKNYKKEFCSRERRPVCGISIEDGKQIKKTYFNQCWACKYGDADFTVKGSCDEYPYDAYFCNPFQHKNYFCPLFYQPVCGYSYNEYGHKKHSVYPNTCIACKNSDVIYVVKGKCPKH